MAIVANRYIIYTKLYCQSAWYIIFWFGIYAKIGIYLVHFCQRV